MGCLDGSGDCFDGFMDEFKLYNYARTDAQIAWDYNRGGPLVQLKFDETGENSCSGGTNDVCNAGSQGSTFDGTSTATRTTSGKLNYALDFNGTDDEVTVANATAIDLNLGLTNGFSISSWIYPDTDGESDTGRIWDKGTNNYCRLGGESGGVANVICIVNLTTEAEFTATQTVTIGQWNHVVFSWTNDADDEVTVCVNGVCSTSTATFAGDPAADTASLFIGGNGSGVGNTAAFDGKIDDIRLFNYELTTTQIKGIMNDGGATRFAPLTGAP